MIPVYRANRTDGLGYIEGYLIKQDDSEKFSIVKNFNLSTIYGMVCPHDIDSTTLAIHFPDMLDSQGNKIFASLNEDGKGGDRLIEDGKYEDGFNPIFEPYFRKSSFSIEDLPQMPDG